MAMKKLLFRIGFVIINFAIIYLLYITGVRAIIGFILGVFVGSCIVIYWSMTKNGYLSFIVEDIIKSKEQKEKEKEKIND